MAKKRIRNYTFTPGVSGLSNAYPNAYYLITQNAEFIKDEASKFIDQQVAIDTAINLYPHAGVLLTNNKNFLRYETTAWIGRQVSQAITYTPTGASYNPATGVMTLTIGAHSLAIGDVIRIATGSLDFTCALDGNVSVKSYPRASGVPNPSGTDPVYDNPVIITAVGATTITVNVGISSDTSAHTFVGADPAAITVGFSGFTYDIDKCRRDVGYVIDAYINDLRYGGNEETREVASLYWVGETPQVDGDRYPEVAAHEFLRFLINNYIFTRTAWPALQGTYTQDVTGSNGESGSDTRITALAAVIKTVISDGLSAMPAISYGATFANYTFNDAKCQRDIGYVLDAYLWDIRYGGNRNTREVASRYWVDDTPQVDGDRTPEIATHNFIRDLINNYILTNTAYASLQSPVVTTQTIDLTKTLESGVQARVTTLSGVVTTVIAGGLGSLPTLVNGAGTVSIGGKWTRDQLLLITNVQSNVILYNFADPNAGAILTEREPTDPDIDTEINYGFTRITLNVDTSSMSSTDFIQIFVEDYEELRTRPYDFGTDAIERQRVANSQAMLDADFEYGLQPTKWQALSLARSYPGAYEVPGTDTPVTVITTDASTGTGGIGQSLITVTTSGAHGLAPGLPFTIRALNAAVTGFSRAEGVFTVNTTPSSTQFTYYAKAKVGTIAGTELQETYTLVRRGAFYTGADIGTPTFTVFSQGSSGTFTPALTVPSGSTVIPYAGSIPPVNAPVTASGFITLGTTISAVTGTGSSDTVSYTGLTGTNVSGIGVNAEFDVDRISGVYTVTVADGGTGYAVNDQIIIYGTSLDGTSPGNDILITVDTVDGVTGEILTITFTGSGIASGITVTQSLSDTASAGTSTLVFTDSTGIIPGLAFDRGDGSATVVTDVTGTTVTVSRPLTSTFTGASATFNSVSATGIIGDGVGAVFDVSRTGTLYTPTIVAAGLDYEVGDTLLITGDLLGGNSPANDLVMTVSSIGVSGALTGVTSTGIAFDSVTYNAVTTTNVTGQGTLAVFDVERSGTAYSDIIIATAGTDYVAGDKFTVAGTEVGGATPANDITITVSTVNGLGGITAVTWTGTAVIGTNSYVSPAVDSTSGIGTGADFTVDTSGTTYSVTVTDTGDTTRTPAVPVATGVTNSTANFKYGTASLLVLNSISPATATNYLTIPSSADYQFGSGDFTVEFWFRRTAGGANQTLFDMRNASSDAAVLLGLNSSNQLYFFVNGGAAITGTTGTVLNTWNHLALSRVSGNTYLFLNGTQEGSAYTDSTVYALRPIVIGADYTGGGDGFVGFIDDLRISKTLGRYSSTFTPPTAALVHDSNTNLLLHFDGANGTAAFEDDVGGYKTGDTITILGTELGGATPANDLTITVTGATAGQIGTVSAAGTALDEDTYSAVATTLITGQGSGFFVDVITNGTAYETVSLDTSGSGYIVGDIVDVLGTDLGGATPANDIRLQITAVGSGGAVGSFSVLSGTAAVSTDSFTTLSPTNIATRGTGALFTIGKAAGSYTLNAVEGPGGDNYVVGNKLQILGNQLGGTIGLHDLTLTVTSVDTSGSIVSGTVSGTASGGTPVNFYSTVTISDPTIAQLTIVNSIAFAAIAVIEVNFTSNHGLVPGAAVLVNISSTGLNQNLASGPFFVEQVPTVTSFRYTARAQGNINTVGLAGTVYARVDTFFQHRPFDGGVQLGTGGPQHGAQAIRMSKNYIRYQSGKGLMYTTGALFAPSYDILNASSAGTAVGSTITVETDDVDHGLQIGADVRLIGIETTGYNNDYVVTSIIDERTFTVTAVQQLGSTTATLTSQAQISLYRWSGATVRAGCFDDQNGMFWQYNGQRLAVGVRSGTFQLAGSVTATPGSNLLTGLNTRFRDQLKAGDKIIIRGMTHTVTAIPDHTTLYMAPDYRGANTSNKVKLCKVIDRLFYQEDWDRDFADGTGPSGYNIDITKMQMIGIQYTWYGAGFIDWMLRGKEGNFLFVHRVRNNNVNTEAFMRSANLPVRYEVVNDGALGQLATDVSVSDTTLTLTSAEDFPDTGTVYIDNELISYSSKNDTQLLGLVRGTNLQNFAAGSTRTYSAGAAAAHDDKTGVILVSNRTSPAISHWGSAYLTDGGFDTDRGYLFNYQATSFIASTTRATAFLIRLAPSVSNAIVGDLGDRELINRAQLLLQGIEVTAGTGSASGIVIEGILNPSNYPTDPTLVDWRTLANPSLGGLPSFAQVALGTSVTWNNAFTVTFDAATQRYNANRTYYADFVATDVANVRLGMTVGSPTTAVAAVIPGGTTVSGIGGIFNVSGTNYRTIYFSRSFTGNVPQGSTISFSSIAAYAAPGETIFSFVGLPNNQTNLDLTALKEITNTAIGGRGMYPNGPDVLAINCYLTGGSNQEVSIVLRWSEAQA